MANASLFFHIRHDLYTPTLGKVGDIYNSIQAINKTGLSIGLEPQILSDYSSQLHYYTECGSIPTMLNILTSDEKGAPLFSASQIDKILQVCNVEYFRIHEAVSYLNVVNGGVFPTNYVRTLAQNYPNIRIFWSEWDYKSYPIIDNVIDGLEDRFVISFGTNGNYIEPKEAFRSFLSKYPHKGASIQSWYWWERNGKTDGLEKQMPAKLMQLHTKQALDVGCEVIQYEPYWYFFDGTTPKTQLRQILEAPF